MAIPALRPCSFMAVATALFAGVSSSFFATAVDLTATTCEELASLPTDNLTEDSRLIIRGSVYTCDEVTTVKVHGPYMLTAYGEIDQVLSNVRFAISGGADFNLQSVMGTLNVAMMFTGITELALDGGVFNVELGSSATIEVFPTFEHNSVQAGYSGGAIYAGGKVHFLHDTTFNENSVMSDDSGPSGNGGAVFVEHGGAVVFDGKTDFTYNEVGRGGRGGAVANLGSLVFTGPSAQATFTDNAASAYTSSSGDASGGHGGAVFTGESGVTSISGLTSASHNSAFSGGALYNSGTTILASTTDDLTTQFADNEAEGGDTANGGHIYTDGAVVGEEACALTYGSATGNGGAVYVDDEGSFNCVGGVTYASNAAHGECDDVYVSGGHPVCQPSTEAGVGTAFKSQ